MYEEYTRQSLPSRKYRELLGSAICVFNSNVGFIIENILKNDIENTDWYELIDSRYNKHQKYMKDTLFYVLGKEFEELYFKIIKSRNRIIHSFRITNEKGEQTLATKTKIKDGNKQFHITEEYLMEFIQMNEKLSDMLYEYREIMQSYKLTE